MSVFLILFYYCYGIKGMESVILAKDLTKRYGKLTALNRISFSVYEGDIFGFLGPNGAGKTTAIKIMSTLLTPDGGGVWICNNDVVAEQVKVKKKIGIVPERVGFYEELTAYKLLDFYARFYDYTSVIREKRVLGLLRLVGLIQFSHIKVKNYSHGMRQKLAIAQALIHNPKILILDEPTIGLDPRATFEFKGMIKKLNKLGMTIFLSSHILTDVEELCNRTCILNRGKVIYRGSISELKQASMKERRIVVRVESMKEEILNSLKKFEGIDEISFEDSTLYVNTSLDIASDINSFLVSNGIRVNHLSTEIPSLEKIFLALTKR